MVNTVTRRSITGDLDGPYGTGHGRTIAHHGEILQGVFEEPCGRIRRGLVSLLCSMFNSEAFFRPDTTGVVSVDPVWRIKAKRAAEVTLVALGAKAIGGSLRVRSNVPTAWGLGSSTSDVTSTIRAVAEAMRMKLTGEAIAKLAICAEAASDPLM